MMESVDPLDLRLIRCLQDNPRAPYSAIGRATGVSETTAKRRIDDLIGRGVIQPAMIAHIEQIGFAARTYLFLKVAPGDIVPVAERLCAFPESISVGLITGRFDVICLVALAGLDELAAFLAERIAPIEGVVAVETAVCPAMLKMFADWRIPEGSYGESVAEPGDDGAG